MSMQHDGAGDVDVPVLITGGGMIGLSMATVTGGLKYHSSSFKGFTS